MRKSIIALMGVLIIMNLFGCTKKKEIKENGTSKGYDYSNAASEVLGWWKTPDHANYLLFVNEENIEIWFLNRKTESFSYRLNVDEINGNAELVIEEPKAEFYTLKDVRFIDGDIELLIDYDISGPLPLHFIKGEAPFSGIDIIDDELMKEFEGIWEEKGSSHNRIEIKDGVMTLINVDENGKETRLESCRIHIIRYKENGKIQIHNVDLSDYSLLHFAAMDYDDGKLITQIMVFDADPIRVCFEKNK